MIELFGLDTIRKDARVRLSFSYIMIMHSSLRKSFGKPPSANWYWMSSSREYPHSASRSGFVLFLKIYAGRKRGIGDGKGKSMWRGRVDVGGGEGGGVKRF